jgi:Trk-type K+ transport system membrane component
MNNSFIEVAFGLITITIPLIVLGGTAFWIWMLIDCIQSKLSENEKTAWILVIALTNFIGALIYFLTIRNKKK